MQATLTESGWLTHDGSIDPKRGFEICDEDNESDPLYFGFEHTTGRWIIMKQSIANKSYRYACGLTDYATAWTNRASLGYDRPGVAFKKLP